MSDEQVDLVVLTRDNRPLRDEVQQGISQQCGLRINQYRHVGLANSKDVCRWQTIARARNEAKSLGNSKWFMFLDDDVVLEPNTVRRLLDELKQRPLYGAMAADYMGESTKFGDTRHVTMGATLFRRSALNRVRFRWKPKQCECLFCCDDLRHQMIGIRYATGICATHLSDEDAIKDVTEPANEHPIDPNSTKIENSGAHAYLSGLVLTAFDRKHFSAFHKQFYVSLRSSGNTEQISVAGYGLYPSHRSIIEQLRDVRLFDFPACQKNNPSRQRLRDFQLILSNVDDEVPVAYWDAGDVIFQGSLSPLWDVVRKFPNQLLAVREHDRFVDCPCAQRWVSSIADRNERRKALELLSERPVLNGGFAAGTAKTMKEYLAAADQLRKSIAMDGTSDWGDQTALNLFCHGNREAWQEIDSNWNFCLHAGCDAARVHDGRIIRNDGESITVVHGCGGSLHKLPGYHGQIARRFDGAGVAVYV